MRDFTFGCNSIHPGATLTNILRTAIEQMPEVEEACKKMSPLNRMGTVEEVAAMAVFLLPMKPVFAPAANMQ